MSNLPMVLLKESIAKECDLNVSLIDRVEDRSDSFMNRALIHFTNGEDLSVIRGEYSYGGHEGLFEIMPSDSKFIKPEHAGDKVVGWLTVEQVNEYIKIIASA